MNAPTKPDLSVRIGQYVALRDKIKELDDAHKEKMKPFRDTLEQLNGLLLAGLQEAGGDSVKTANGTAYVTTKKSATIADPAEFRRHVIGTEAWDLIDFRVNAPAVQKFLEENKHLPPGVNFTTHNEVGVRRPTAKES